MSHPAPPLEPTALVVGVGGIALAGALYAGRVRRLRRTGAPLGRIGPRSFAVGVAVALAAFLGLAGAARNSLTYHELRLIAVGEVAGLALAIGLYNLPRAGRALRDRLGGPIAPLLWLANLYLWHLPATLEGGLHHPPLEALELLCYLAFGANLHLALLSGPRQPTANRELPRLGQALAARLGACVLANLLLWASHVTYPYYIHPNIARQTSPLVDESIAGAVLLFVQLLALLAVWLWAYLRVRGRTQPPSRRAVGRPASAGKPSSGRPQRGPAGLGGPPVGGRRDR